LFDTLSDRLQGVFRELGRKGRLTERDIDEAMREVRRALLEADVNFRVVKQFVVRIQDRAKGAEVMSSLTPAQQVIKIVRDELITTLGEGAPLIAEGDPAAILLVGLQGSGKTTVAAKLGLQLRKDGRRPLLVAADTQRPAAIQQLIALGKQISLPVYSESSGDPVAITMNARKYALENGMDVTVVDTAGRLHIDEQLMAEVLRVKGQAGPQETLLVVDAMTGQEGVNVADEFNKRIGVTGLVLTKLDGDARGGSALSIRAVTGVPIKFVGTGEKLDGFEIFHPDRLAGRILGMGDVLTLVERAQQTVDKQQAVEMQRKLRTATFDLNDFMVQMQQIRQMGSLDQLMEMIPGMNQLAKKLPAGALDEGQFKQIEAIISSMTLEERRAPNMINGSRRRRISRGSGTTLQEVNQLLNQFRQVQKLMRNFSRGKGPKGLMGMFN
jgi:signal recognition particle subunit SRP54